MLLDVDAGLEDAARSIEGVASQLDVYDSEGIGTPVRQQTVPVGHAVRFGYLQTAIAMLLRHRPDTPLLATLEQASKNKHPRYPPELRNFYITYPEIQL